MLPGRIPASKGTLSIPSTYRNSAHLVLSLNNAYDGDWGQIDIDDIRITIRSREFGAEAVEKTLKSKAGNQAQSL